MRLPEEPEFEFADADDDEDGAIGSDEIEIDGLLEDAFESKDNDQLGAAKTCTGASFSDKIS